MDDFKIDDLYTALYKKENVFFLSRDRFNPHYKKYVKEHYGVDVGFETYYQDKIPRVQKVVEEHN